MSKHTPGPWEMVVEDGDMKIVAPPQDAKLALRETLMCDMQYYPWCPTKEADWRLIAAAPELLEALRSLIAAMNWRDAHAAASSDPHKYQYACENVYRHMDAARAAISKATGEA